MKHNSCVLFLVLMICFLIPSQAQVTPAALRTDNLQDALVKGTLGFDSLILVNEAGNQKDDQTLRGFGFQGDKFMRVEIVLNSIPQSDDLKLGKVTQKKEGKKILQKVNQMDFAQAQNFNDDSLSLNKHKGKTIMSVNDGREYSIVVLFPKGNVFILKQSIMPEYYQALAPTADRKAFIELFSKLSVLVDMD
jgi:hypothetical protein